MAKIGLSYEQINEILAGALAPEKAVDVDAMRDVITSAITQNNEKLLEDIKTILFTK